MKRYVSRRRHCWTLLVQMDQVIHFSEGHRSDMLLDLSGLTREERVLVKASINNERDFDRPSLLNITYSSSRKSATNKGQRLRRVKTSRHFQHSLVSRKRQGQTHWQRKIWNKVPITQSARQLRITIMVTTRLNPQMPTKHTTSRLTLELTKEKKFWTMLTMKKMKRFLHMLFWMMSLL